MITENDIQKEIEIIEIKEDILIENNPLDVPQLLEISVVDKIGVKAVGPGQ